MRTRIALAAASAAVFTGAGAMVGPTTSHVAAPTPSQRDLATVSFDHVPWSFPANRLAADLVFVGAFDIGPTPVPPPRVKVPPASHPPVPSPTDATSVWTADWQCIRDYESGNQFNSPDAPSGAYGIIEETWNSFGMPGWPYEAPADEQNSVALELYSLYGWGPWESRYACGL
jgi:Transglycosylase-like domain